MVEETGSGSCPVAGFGINGTEPLGSATRDLINHLVRLLFLDFAGVY
jgi:hypothetical protein